MPLVAAVAARSRPISPGASSAWSISTGCWCRRCCSPCLLCSRPQSAPLGAASADAVPVGLRRAISPRASPSSSARRLPGPTCGASRFVHAMVDAVAICLHPVRERRRRERPRHPARRAGRRHGAAGGQPRRVPARRPRRARRARAADRALRQRLRAELRTTPAPASSAACLPGRAARVAASRTACARARRWCAARRSTSRTWRSSRSTSCSTCARASWWSTTRTASGSSTNRRRRCSATAAPIPGALLGEASPQLLYLLETWRQRTAHAGDAVADLRRGRRRPRDPAALRVARRRGARAGHRVPRGHELLAAKIQQSKLAALGRLSASIAHEIRNPVGAMSHAASCSASRRSSRPRTSGSPRSSAPTRDRVSRSSNNVLQLSRRENSRPERLSLGDLARRTSATSSARRCSCRRSACAVDRAARRRRSAGRSDAAAPDRLEPVRERGASRRAASRRRRPSRLRIGRLAPARGRSSKSRTAARASPAQHRERIFEPFFTRQRAAARASACSWRASSRRPTAPRCSMSRAPAAAACSASCSPIRNAGWPDRRGRRP